MTPKAETEFDKSSSPDPMSLASAATTAAAPGPAAQLDQRTLDIILAADLANIVKKVKAGKPLSASEREILKQRLINAPVPGTPAATNGGGTTIPSLLAELQEMIGPPPKSKGGRPKFKIDYQLVERLARLQCTQEEIASVLGCSVDTLARDGRFCGIYKKGMAHGAICLRRHQWRAAEEGNVTMLIWLGKQYLGQTDRQHIKLEPPANPADLTMEQITMLPTAELRRLIGQAPPRAYIIEQPSPATNGTNGHHSTAV